MEVLKTMMQAQVDPMFNDTDFEYRLYLQDHREMILDRCEQKAINTNDMATFEYRPKEFLYANHYPVAAWWLVLWINGINGQEHFKNLKFLLFPDLAQLEDLFQHYRTLRSEWNKAKIKMTST